MTTANLSGSLPNNRPTLTTGPLGGAVIPWHAAISQPKPVQHCSQLERQLITALYEASLAGFRAFWCKEPHKQISDLYWERARYDAHATTMAGNQPLA